MLRISSTFLKRIAVNKVANENCLFNVISEASKTKSDNFKFSRKQNFIFKILYLFKNLIDISSRTPFLHSHEVKMAFLKGYVRLNGKFFADGQLQKATGRIGKLEKDDIIDVILGADEKNVEVFRLQILEQQGKQILFDRNWLIRPKGY